MNRKSPRTRKAHSLLKRAMRARHTRKRSHKIPGVTIGPITVTRAKSRSARKPIGPQKGDRIEVSLHPRFGPILVSWSPQNEPATPGFLSHLSKNLKEEHS